ncbi:MAG: hypothetical protein LUD00_03745 [Prevotellaceae bacterium]|nr:hypothetical protein [Prevotellaceae bacterium]
MCDLYYWQTFSTDSSCIVWMVRGCIHRLLMRDLRILADVCQYTQVTHEKSVEYICQYTQVTHEESVKYTLPRSCSKFIFEQFREVFLSRFIGVEEGA